MKDHDSVSKFLDLLQTQDKKQLRNTALYLKLAEKSRLESRVMLCVYILYFKRCTLYTFIEINSVLLFSVCTMCENSQTPGAVEGHYGSFHYVIQANCRLTV